ncbi:MAG: glycosyltransferase family 2 protein [Odoribacter sp.]
MPTIKATLILSTYNRPDALALCLESIARQTVLPDEVIIGDDGSKEATLQVIESYQKTFPVPLIHIWQEDKGFRLAKARNKCIARAQYEYIIQIDGDLILHRDFVKDHLVFAREGCYIKGGRVNINLKLTQKLCSTLNYFQPNFFTSGLIRRENSIHCIPIARFLAPRRKTAPGLGCNMSYWKKDVIEINGYDEFFVGWGGEDYDLAMRLFHLGKKKLALKFAAIGFHLWHNDLYMDNKDKNFSYYYNKIDKKAIRCEQGVNQYLK